MKYSNYTSICNTDNIEEEIMSLGGSEELEQVLVEMMEMQYSCFEFSRTTS